MFGRKKERKENPELATIYEKLGDNEFLIQGQMLYWKRRNRLTATFVTLSDGNAVIDMDVLDAWIYPDTKQKLTQEERSEFESQAYKFLQCSGYQVDTEYSGHDGIAKRERKCFRK